MNRREEIEQARKLAADINHAGLSYRAILRAMVGPGHFENIDSWATTETISLFDAAVRYANQELSNASQRARKA